MQPIETADVRKAFVNSSKSKAASATFPRAWPPADVEDLDFVGWVDPKAPQRAYLVTEIDDRPTALELRLTEAVGSTRKTLCDLCHPQDSPEGARLMVAPRAGARGRGGDTVGLYMCADFGCSSRVRTELKESQRSVSGLPDTRVDDLRARLRDFVGRVLAA